MISPQPIFSIRCELANILDLGPTPFGHRRVVNILGGGATGAKLNGRVLPGGPDWQIVAADGSIDVHARYTIESEAGAPGEGGSKGQRRGPPGGPGPVGRRGGRRPATYYFFHAVGLRAAPPTAG